MPLKLKNLFSRNILAITLALLTAASSALFNISFAAIGFAQKEELQVKAFTSSAVPIQNLADCSSADAMAERRSHVSEAMAAASMSASSTFTDSRILVLGYCKDVEPVLDKELHSFSFERSYPHTTEKNNDNQYLPLYNSTYPNDIGLFEVVCTMDYRYAQDGSTFIENRVSFVKSLYRSGFQSASRIPSEILFPHYDIIMLQKDKKYLLLGTFRALEWTPNKNIDFSLGAPFSEIDMFPDYPGYPYIIELPDGLTAEEYIETDEGKEKLGGMVEMFEKNVHSVPVVLTDSLMSIYNFNSGKTPVKQGRAFTDEEYVSGAQVCVISSALAKANGLKVGDTLDMQFYNRGRLNSDKVGLITDTELYAPYFSGITPITESMKYEIVGIYESSGRFLFGEHDFTPNTIFIPSASMTDGAVRENLNADWEPVPTKLTSIVIENGKLDEFQEEMKSLGFEDCFIYCDENGMTQTLAEASQNEDRVRPVFAASAAAFTAAAILFAAVAGASIKRSDEYKALLAKSRAKAYISSLLSMLVFGFCALAAGAVISYFLFDTVAAMLTGANSGIDFSPIAALKALGLETIVTAAAAAAASMTKKDRHIS